VWAREGHRGSLRQTLVAALPILDRIGTATSTGAVDAAQDPRPQTPVPDMAPMVPLGAGGTPAGDAHRHTLVSWRQAAEPSPLTFISALPNVAPASPDPSPPP
jgi:hypothetical protein